MPKSKKKFVNAAKSSTKSAAFAKPALAVKLPSPSKVSIKTKPNHPNNGQSDDQTASDQSKSGDTIMHFDQVNYLTISEHQDGQRLDNFLLSRLKGLPRSHVYKMIRDDEVRINKKRAKPHDRLVVGDVVRVAPVRLPSLGQVVVSDDLKQVLLSCVLYEDEGLMVINKPFGMAVHGGSGESVGVIEGMRAATGKKYLELVHRIDKGTSGLLMIAKKRSTLKLLQDAFRQKTIQKSYLCLVAGKVSPVKQLIDKPLLKYSLPSGERRVKVSADGKPSQTAIRVVAHLTYQNRPISLVLAAPKTGRTHQIRVHMQSIGHPLLGDDKYNPSDNTHRLCLHAYRLQVADYPSFEASLPDDLRMLIERANLDYLYIKDIL